MNDSVSLHPSQCRLAALQEVLNRQWVGSNPWCNTIHQIVVTLLAAEIERASQPPVLTSESASDDG